MQREQSFLPKPAHGGNNGSTALVGVEYTVDFFELMWYTFIGNKATRQLVA